MPSDALSDKSALVLFSGGQDSTTCLAWALDRYELVETLGFDYGQRHAVEMAQRPGILAKMREMSPKWGERLGCDRVITIDLLKQITVSALLEGDRPFKKSKGDLPASFVPGRNVLFMTLAAIVGHSRRTKFLVGGMCETDFSGYPDCRDDTLKALQVALNLAILSRTYQEHRMVIETPLMWLTKADTFALAQRLGGDKLIDLILEDTHTCYNGDRKNRHAWGYGCAECDACRLRAKGWGAWWKGSS